MDCWPLGSWVVCSTRRETAAPAPGVKVRTTVRPRASVVVMTSPMCVPERTTESPNWSVVVSTEGVEAAALLLLLLLLLLAVEEEAP